MTHVKLYSLKRDGTRRLAPNFLVREFACHDGSDRILVADELVAVLQAVRDRYDEPVFITSGYRTAEWNLRVGGVKDSQHLLGTAADINVAGVLPRRLYEMITKGRVPGIDPEKIGCGLYMSFVHLDVRGHKARWSGTGVDG